MRNTLLLSLLIISLQASCLLMQIITRNSWWMLGSVGFVAPQLYLLPRNIMKALKEDKRHR